MRKIEYSDELADQIDLLAKNRIGFPTNMLPEFKSSGGEKKKFRFTFSLLILFEIFLLGVFAGFSYFKFGVGGLIGSICFIIYIIYAIKKEKINLDD